MDSRTEAGTTVKYQIVANEKNGPGKALPVSIEDCRMRLPPAAQTPENRTLF